VTVDPGNAENTKGSIFDAEDKKLSMTEAEASMPGTP